MMLDKPNEWAEQWHVLRPDADFRKITEENKTPSLENATGFTDSYEALRSSPDDDSGDVEQPYMRRRSSSLGSRPEPKSVLVYPGSDKISDNFEMPTNTGKSDTYPQKMDEKDVLKLDDEELKALTKENTKLNRSNDNSPTYMKKV